MAIPVGNELILGLILKEQKEQTEYLKQLTHIAELKLLTDEEKEALEGKKPGLLDKLKDLFTKGEQ